MRWPLPELGSHLLAVQVCFYLQTAGTNAQTNIRGVIDK